MFTSLLLKILMGILRHVITVAVPVMIASGYLDANQANDFLGSALFLGGVAFSAFDKFVSHRKENK